VFTGIIEEIGTVREVHRVESGVRMRIDAHVVLDDVHLGDSIAVNGVCLTATELALDSVTVDAVPETLERSNLGGLVVGDVVNLERPMRVDGRLDGHIVQGHVDGVGRVVRAGPTDNGGVVVEVRPAAPLLRYIVEKGSITIDGVSLTVASLTGDTFSVALIPHTLEVTNLGKLGPDAEVNLEVDVIAKYVERLMEAHQR